jgi:ParB family chromosome partitioning protein
MASPAPKLGRGLASLLGEASTPGATRTSLPITQLEPGPFQPRVNMDPDALAELTASIRQQGVLQPILARPHPVAPGRHQIIAGERRWRAATAAGLHEVPVLLRPLSDTEAMAAALVENLQRQDLDAIEEADGYNRLLEEFGLTQEQLGGLVGKSRSHVTNTLRLLNLPLPVRAHIQSGALTPGHARALLHHKDPEAAAALVIARGLNVRQTEALLNRAEPRAKPEPDKETEALERQISLQLGLKTTITTQGNGGTVHIAYRNLDQLDAIIERLVNGKG